MLGESEANVKKKPVVFKLKNPVILNLCQNPSLFRF
jgi:hypothetical protein